MNEHDHGTPDEPVEVFTFTDGWLDKAIHRPCHPGRLGGWISPACIGWHCTDMAPGTGPALSRARQASAGAGNAEHFVVWEDGTVVQHASVNRNANHMGGPDALRVNGWHPNLVTIGIEMCNPGLVQVLNPTDAMFVFEGKYHLVDTDVVGTRGKWRIAYSDKQLAAARWLARALASAVSLGSGKEEVVVEGTSGGKQYRVLAPRYGLRHSTINPYRKTDPGPQFPAEFMHRITWVAKHQETAP